MTGSRVNFVVNQLFQPVIECRTNKDAGTHGTASVILEQVLVIERVVFCMILQ
jgi:hypothetical protein